jgi:hypothetical protein
VEGKSWIGCIDDAGRSALHDRLFTVGELMRQNQLATDKRAIMDADERQLKLFSLNGHA